jgi:hypothetical protein
MTFTDSVESDEFGDDSRRGTQGDQSVPGGCLFFRDLWSASARDS